MSSAQAGPSLRAFALIGGFEAIARGVTLSGYPLALYRAQGDAVVVSQIHFAVGGAGLLAAWLVAGRLHPKLGVRSGQRLRGLGSPGR